MFLNVMVEILQDQIFILWFSVVFKVVWLFGDVLIFQIREGDVNNYLKQVKDFVKLVYELYCKVFIVQFGCVLNLFNMFKYLDVDYVKIDGLFIEEIQKNEDVRE